VKICLEKYGGDDDNTPQRIALDDFTSGNIRLPTPHSYKRYVSKHPIMLPRGRERYNIIIPPLQLQKPYQKSYTSSSTKALSKSYTSSSTMGSAPRVPTRSSK